MTTPQTKRAGHDDTPRTSTVTNASLQREYASLSDHYDRRWRHYNDDVAHRLQAAGVRPGTPGLLDVGCGTGALLQRFGNGQSIGVDPSMAMLTSAPQSLALTRARGEALPFYSARFDTVLSTSALHYCNQPAQVLAECRRVLRDGGRLLLIDWCADAWSTRLAVGALRLMHRPLGRVLSLQMACRLVAAAGFQIIASERFRAWPAWGLFLIEARAK